MMLGTEEIAFLEVGVHSIGFSQLKLSSFETKCSIRDRLNSVVGPIK